MCWGSQRQMHPTCLHTQNCKRIYLFTFWGHENGNALSHLRCNTFYHLIVLLILKVINKLHQFFGLVVYRCELRNHSAEWNNYFELRRQTSCFKTMWGVTKHYCKQTIEVTLIKPVQNERETNFLNNQGSHCLPHLNQHTGVGYLSHGNYFSHI